MGTGRVRLALVSVHTTGRHSDACRRCCCWRNSNEGLFRFIHFAVFWAPKAGFGVVVTILKTTAQTVAGGWDAEFRKGGAIGVVT